MLIFTTRTLCLCGQLLVLEETEFFVVPQRGFVYAVRAVDGLVRQLDLLQFFPVVSPEAVELPLHHVLRGVSVEFFVLFDQDVVGRVFLVAVMVIFGLNLPQFRILPVQLDQFQHKIALAYSRHLASLCTAHRMQMTQYCAIYTLQIAQYIFRSMRKLHR